MKMLNLAQKIDDTHEAGENFTRVIQIFFFKKGRTPEKAMAPHSSTLAWKIPWMEEPGRLQSTGLRRVRHD